jgi:RimJ/RimL family protein N-acetyltransferase
MASKHPYWPLFDLRIVTPTIELRHADEDDIVALAALGAGGVHDPDWMPFAIPWTDAPSPQQERNSVQHYWLNRAQWTVDDWHCMFATVVDGAVVGTQAVSGLQFAARRVVVTGSWLGRDYQGRGIGKEMRAAVLHFAFAGLGATRAESGAWHDNGPSLGVSKALGYEENGDEIAMRRDEAQRQIRLKLTRGGWEQTRRGDIEIIGLDPCLEMFGVV